MAAPHWDAPESVPVCPTNYSAKFQVFVNRLGVCADRHDEAWNLSPRPAAQAVAGVAA
jgi:hypothetical protein